MRRFLIGLRTSIKIVALLVVSMVIIFTIAMCVYKPIYSVTLNGEMIGYSRDRATLQTKINDYTQKGQGDVAFIQIDEMPEYKLCFLKRGIETNDEEIYEKVISTGEAYYKYYALTINGEEKLYVETFSDAQEVVDALKDKNSNNLDRLGIKESWATEKKEYTNKDTAVSALFEEKIVVAAANEVKDTSKPSASETSSKSNGKVTKAKIGKGYKSAGINFIRPVSGTVSSRYGPRWGTTHKGTDIAASTGTPIKAAAAGTVTFSGKYSTYGNLVIISHGNGVQTYYGHCSVLNVKEGQKVSSGQVIAKVGSTGNATGPHLHFEIRINGVSYNAELYI